MSYSSLALPLLDGLTDSGEALEADCLHLPNERLPWIEWRTRRGPVLHPSPFNDDPEVLSLNLSQGCLHRCSFCSLRGNESYRGDETIYLYRDTPEQLDRELRLRVHGPRAVILSPSSDLFGPELTVQQEALKVIKVLSRHGVAAWLMTRGIIRPRILDELLTIKSGLRIRVALTTVNRRLQRVLEPLTAPPMLRLKQLERLVRAGVAVDVVLEPLLPGLTDMPANLRPLLRALAERGIRQIAAGYAFLRTGIRENLREALTAADLPVEELEAAYEGGPLLTSGQIAAARYLPRKRRQRGYASLMALAAEFGIHVQVCPGTNPDFQPSRPRPDRTGSRISLRTLFASAGHAG